MQKKELHGYVLLCDLTPDEMQHYEAKYLDAKQKLDTGDFPTMKDRKNQEKLVNSAKIVCDFLRLGIPCGKVCDGTWAVEVNGQGFLYYSTNRWKVIGKRNCYAASSVENFLKRQTQQRVPTVDEVRLSEGKCPECGSPTAWKYGRSGVFLACSGYPHCRAQLELVNGQVVVKSVKVVGVCVKCGQPVVEKKSKFDNGVFYGCSGYPKCRCIYSQSSAGTLILRKDGEETQQNTISSVAVAKAVA